MDRLLEVSVDGLVAAAAEAILEHIAEADSTGPPVEELPLAEERPLVEAKLQVMPLEDNREEHSLVAVEDL